MFSAIQVSLVSQVRRRTDVLPTLLSSEILVGMETGGGARLGHTLQQSRNKQLPLQHWPNELCDPSGSKGHSLKSGHQPESVLEAREEAGGDAESRV